MRHGLRQRAMLTGRGITLLMVALSACGGGSHSTPAPTTPKQLSAGTPKGIYTVFVTARNSAGTTVGSPIGPFMINVQ